jgi:REP element-mobilizing transposase RayT
VNKKKCFQASLFGNENQAGERQPFLTCNLLFIWQKGYGAFSIGQSQVATVTRYIKNQKEHHKKRNFEDEFRAFLKKYEIEYDERYVWD